MYINEAILFFSLSELFTKWCNIYKICFLELQHCLEGWVARNKREPLEGNKFDRKYTLKFITFMLGKWDLNLLIPCLVMSWQSYLAKESIACLEMRSHYKLTALSAGGCGSQSGDPGWCRWWGGSCPAPAQPGSHWRRRTSPGAWRRVNTINGGQEGTFLNPD